MAGHSTGHRLLPLMSPISCGFSGTPSPREVLAKRLGTIIALSPRGVSRPSAHLPREEELTGARTQQIREGFLEEELLYWHLGERGRALRAESTAG